MYSTIMGFYEDYMKNNYFVLFCAYMIYYSYTKLYIYDSIFDSIVFFYYVAYHDVLYRTF